MTGDENADGEVGLRARLGRLRTELSDLAFTLERRGRFDAADLALATSARLGELCEESAPTKVAGAAASPSVNR